MATESEIISMLEDAYKTGALRNTNIPHIQSFVGCSYSYACHLRDVLQGRLKTVDMICPFCGEKLKSVCGCYACQNNACENCCVIMPPRMWQALIQSQKDLETATEALKDIKKVCDGCRWCDSNLYDPTPSDGRRIAETTNKALEQIEHKDEQ